MGPQPRVDAGDVEAMAALRQYPDFIPYHELRQANRAIGEFRRGFSGEGGLGEGLEDFLLEAFVGRRHRTG